jgi:hypothetical protein
MIRNILLEDIMAKKKTISTQSMTVRDELFQLEKEKNDYLNSIKNKEDTLKGSYKTDLKVKIQQKQGELKELEKEYVQLFGKKTTRKAKTTVNKKGVKKIKAKSDLEKVETKVIKNEKSTKKKEKKANSIKVPTSFTDEEIKKVLEALANGISDIETIRKTYLPYRRKPSIIKLINACKNSESKEVAVIRSTL